MTPSDLVANKLAEIIKQYGIELIDEPSRCTGLLKDFCGEHKREINLLILALKERVPYELLSSASTVPEQMIVARLAKRLHDEHGSAEDFAKWAVSAWVKALGSRLVFAMPAVPKPPVVKPAPAAYTPVAQNTTTSQTSTPLDEGLKKLLYKVAGTWADPAVWPDLWKQIAGQAVKHGLDERMVRRRVKVLWDELEPVVLEQKRLEEQKRVEQKRQEELKRQEEARRKEQKRLEDEKIRIATEERNKRHLELLKSWLKTRPNGKWDYLQWDDFLDTLEPPVDLAFLEKIRDGVYTDSFTGMEFVPVMGGSFMMGDTFGDGEDDEKPVHEICLDTFYIGKYLVTQEQWQKVMGSNPSNFNQGGENCPVESVSWNDVQQFIERLNKQTGKKYRLPTEAEWEYAARSGGKNEKYAGGNDINAVAWYDGNSGDKTHTVGKKKPNDLGIYDMSGNVWEWCSDWYDDNYYAQSPKNNPTGAASGVYRVLRGGCRLDAPETVRASKRHYSFPDSRFSGFGFRLVLLSQD